MIAIIGISIMILYRAVCKVTCVRTLIYRRAWGCIDFI